MKQDEGRLLSFMSCSKSPVILILVQKRGWAAFIGGMRPDTAAQGYSGKKPSSH